MMLATSKRRGFNEITDLELLSSAGRLLEKKLIGDGRETETG